MTDESSSPWQQQPAPPPADPWSRPAPNSPWQTQYPEGYEHPQPPQPAETTQPLPAADVPAYTGTGWSAYPPQGYAEPSTRAPRSRGTSVMLVAAMALAGLVGGGIGTAVTLARDDGNTTSAATTDTRGTTAPVTSGQNTGPVPAQPQTAVGAIAKALIPSVVEIGIETTQSGGTGSGVVISADGYIITNNHVVEDATQIRVRLVDKTVDATVVGTDPLNDLAVIKAKSDTPLKPAPLGSSESVQVGDPVIAIGSPLGLAGTVTTGIISALDRRVNVSANESLYGMIQTDAAINPGNSGGALVDTRGRVIGINSAIATLGQSLGGQGGSIGLGFAIPIDLANDTAQQLIKTGKVVHPQLGVRVSEIGQDAAKELNVAPGALVVLVEPGSAADKAGIQVDDVITQINGKAVSSGDDLVLQIRAFRVGDKVKVTYNRKGKATTVDATLQLRPGE